MYKLFFLIGFLSALAVDASKARVQALSNSFHLIDEQFIYSKPIQLTYLENLVALETGVTTATTNSDGAEALVLYSLGESQRFAMSLGHQDEAIIERRNLINAIAGSNFELAQNPLSLFYSAEEGMTPYALGISYSGKSDELADLKESSLSLHLGLEIGRFQINTTFVPLNSVEAVGGEKFNGAGYWQTSLSYLLDQTAFEFLLRTGKGETSTELNGSTTINELHSWDVVILGLADSDVKIENDFFWGAQIILTNINCKLNLSAGCDKKLTSTVLPAWFGIEAQANDWLTLRSSIKQSFLVNISKDEFGYPASVVHKASGVASDFQAGLADTVVSAGFGFKIKNLKLDGTISSATTQKLDLNNFLSQVSLAYAY